MRGLVISHLPMTTFCWLPPESEATGPSMPSDLDLEELDDRRRSPPSSALRVDDAEAAETFDRGKREIVAHRHGQHQALVLAILGDQRHANVVRLGCARAGESHCLAVDLDGPVRPDRRAEQGEQELALALAIEAAEPHDFARP